MEKIPSWKANNFSASEKFARFYGIQGFISGFITVLLFAPALCLINIVYAIWACFFKIAFNIILFLLRSSNGSVLCFPSIILYAFHFSPQYMLTKYNTLFV